MAKGTGTADLAARRHRLLQAQSSTALENPMLGYWQFG
jgi:hypothetical protein